MLRTGGVNLMALVSIQAANAVIPLLIVPLALSRLGAVPYAELAVAEAMSMLVLALVLFSFEVDGVARVVGRSPLQDATHLSETLSDLVSTRFVLFAGGATVAIIGGTLSTGHFPTLLALYLLVPFGQVFHSYWFYQGIERNLTPAVATVAARATALMLVFLFVDQPSRQWLVPLFVGVPFVTAGIISLAYTRWRFQLTIEWCGLARLGATLRRGREIFVGNAAVTLYREMNVVLLSIAGLSSAGIAAYSLVEKTVKMIQACTRPLSQFFFPKVLRDLASFNTPSPAAARRVARFTLYQVLIMLLLLIAIPAGYALIAPHWSWLRAFGEMRDVIAMFCIMAPSTVFGLANFMFGSAALNYLGAQRYMLVAILSTGLMSAALCVLLGARLGPIGGAICFLFSEAFLFALILSRFLLVRQRSRFDGTTA